MKIPTVFFCNESAIKATQTAMSGICIPVARSKPMIDLSWCVLFILLSSGSLFSPPVSAVTGYNVPEIASDNADISSPQTTLSSLIRLTNLYHELVSEKGITRENQERLKNINQQFEKLFDLRQVPPKFRRNVAAETAVYLREAMARFPLPRLEDVPDEDRMVSYIKDGKAAFYRLPGTPVVISKTNSGVYEGRYQFSSATVSEAQNWYEVARQYPYMVGQNYIEGLYYVYFLTPGPMFPYELIRALPEWLVIYWFHPPNPWLSLEFAHRVNMQIMERFNAEGIDFAFPTQTLYLAGDSKRPFSQGQQPLRPYG
jgi:hypothetical protein